MTPELVRQLRQVQAGPEGGCMTAGLVFIALVVLCTGIMAYSLWGW